MEDKYLDLDRERLFNRMKDIMKGNKHVSFTDEQLYFIVDEHIRCMIEQGYKAI